MIKSMTGFGRAEIQDEERKITVEIKAVNHRYLDFNIKMPKKFSFFETAVRNVLKEYMQRGKVDVFLSYEDYTKNGVSLQYHPEIARQYMECFSQMAEEFGIRNDVTVSALSRYPEVLTLDEEPTDEKEVWTVLEEAIRRAAEQFVLSREKEGANLKRDLERKLVHMTVLAEKVEARGPQILGEYRRRLEEKTRELLGDVQIEEGRIAAEVVLFADKICTDEETVRLRSHFAHAREALESDQGVGRKLDFIAQEMNREANTILSKANDLETSNLAIELKTEIEKVREQIQNIE